jgi:hypothetical protein
MELIAAPVDGDPDLMLDCIVEEFAWQGYNSEQILRLFLHPDYPALNQLLDCFGPAEIRRRIGEMMNGFDALSVRASVVETPDPDEEHDSDLMELTVLHPD